MYLAVNVYEPGYVATDPPAGHEVHEKDADQIIHKQLQGLDSMAANAEHEAPSIRHEPVDGHGGNHGERKVCQSRLTDRFEQRAGVGLVDEQCEGADSNQN